MKAELMKSSRKNKKWAIVINDRAVHFGDTRYSDYTLHRDADRKKRYLQRHTHENFRSTGIYTPGFWSRWLLWNKKTIPLSISDIRDRFGIKIDTRV